MNIRFVTADDLYSSAQCSVMCFGGAIEQSDLEMPPGLKKLAVFDEHNRVCSQLVINERECFFGENTLKCAAVGGVSTVPLCRGKGYIRALFETMLSEPSLTCFDISLLYPCSTAFYSKFGYSPLCDYVSCVFPLSQIEAVSENPNIAVCGRDDAEALAAAYNALASSYNLSFIRKPSDFCLNPYYSDSYTYLSSDAEGKADGIISLTLDRANDCVRVHDFLFGDIIGFNSLMFALKQYSGIVSNAQFDKLPVGSPVFESVYDLKTVKRSSGVMGSGRIINIDNVLKKIKPPKLSGEFIIETSDTVASNCGKRKISFTEQGVEVSFTDKPPDVTLGVSAFSRLFLCGAEASVIPYIRGVGIIKDNPSFYEFVRPRKTLFTDGF